MLSYPLEALNYCCFLFLFIYFLRVHEELVPEISKYIPKILGYSSTSHIKACLHREAIIVT